MTAVVLDTTVASIVFTGRPEVALYADDLIGATPVLPFQTVAEMLLGAERRGWGRRRLANLATYLAAHTRVDVSDEVVAAWVTVMNVAQQRGRALSEGDAWIAACALATGAPLLTHDSDFRDLGIPGLDVVCHAP